MQMTIYVLIRRHDTGDESDFVVFGSRAEADSFLRDFIVEDCECEGEKPPADLSSNWIDMYLAKCAAAGCGSWWVMSESDVTITLRDMWRAVLDHVQFMGRSKFAAIRRSLAKLCRVN